MPVTQTIEIISNEAAGSGAVTGTGTPPQLAYFTGAAIISSTGHAQVGTNDIIFNNGVAFKTRGITVSGPALVTDYYIGIEARAAAVNVTLPPVASIPDGKVYIVKDESGQNGTFTTNITPQAGEFIDGFVTIGMITNFEGMQIIKRNGAYFRI